MSNGFQNAKVVENDALTLLPASSVDFTPIDTSSGISAYVMAQRDRTLAQRDYILANLCNFVSRKIGDRIGYYVPELSVPYVDISELDVTKYTLSGVTWQEAVKVSFSNWSDSLEKALITDENLYHRDCVLYAAIASMAESAGITAYPVPSGYAEPSWEVSENFSSISEPHRSLPLVPSTFADTDRTLAKNDDILAARIFNLQEIVSNLPYYATRVKYGNVPLELVASDDNSRTYVTRLRTPTALRVVIYLKLKQALVVSDGNYAWYDISNLPDPFTMLGEILDSTTQQNLPTPVASGIPYSGTGVNVLGVAHLWTPGTFITFPAVSGHSTYVECRATSSVTHYVGNSVFNTATLAYPYTPGTHIRLEISYRASGSLAFPINISGWKTNQLALLATDVEKTVALTLTVENAGTLTISRASSSGSLVVTSIVSVVLGVEEGAYDISISNGTNACSYRIVTSKASSRILRFDSSVTGTATLSLLSGSGLSLAFPRYATTASLNDDSPAESLWKYSSVEAVISRLSPANFSGESWEAYTMWVSHYSEFTRLSTPCDAGKYAIVPEGFYVKSNGECASVLTTGKPTVCVASPELIYAGIYIVSV